MSSYKGLGRGARGRIVSARQPVMGQKKKAFKGKYYYKTRQGNFNYRNNQELKFFDTTVGSAIRAIGQIQDSSICLVPQGATQSSRIGRKIVIKKINMKGFIQTPGAQVSGDMLSLALVWDTQCNGANAAYTDIWTVDTLSFAPLNLANSGRFRILKNFKIPINLNTVNTAATTTIPMVYKLKYNKRCNIPIEYSSTTGAISEIRSNNLAWYAICDTTDNQMILNMTTRIRYED